MAVDLQTRPQAEESADVRSSLKRKDDWWSGTLAFFLLFSAFGMWATFRAFENNFYEAGNLLSPFYSPTVQLGIHIEGFSISPALLILPFPLSFRLSCYYYRKALYRSYLADPLGCAVAEPAFFARLRFRKYTGERAFPFVIQNFHRYAFYAAVVFIALLWIDTIKAFLFKSVDGGSHFGMSVGSLVFLINIILLSTYTFSCHSWRHLMGGGLDCYSCDILSKTRYGMWSKISFLNEKHGTWAMMSLCSVALSDVYVWLVASGRITDIRFF